MPFGKKASYESDKFLKSVVLYFIFFSLIVLNVLDFTERLDPSLDFFKKILSWTFLGLLLYKASLSRIFFGERHKVVDLSLIISYFLFVIKDFIQYAGSVIAELARVPTFDAVSNVVKVSFIMNGTWEMPSYLMWLYTTMLEYPLIPILGALFGLLGFLLISLYVTKNLRIGYPSLLQVLGEEGSLAKGKFLIRLSKVFLIVVGFYVVCFNLMMQWLAIAVDAPLLVVGLFFYLFIARGLSIKQKFEKLGSMGEDFYHEFISLFARRTTILWALSGLLVLHLLTDIANYILPYIIHVRDSLFIGALDSRTVVEIFTDAAVNLGFLEKLALGSGYVLSVLGMTLLMFAPAYIWNMVYKKQGIEIKLIPMLLFVVSVTYFLLNPVFNLGLLATDTLSSEGADVGSRIIGVKIGMQPIVNNPMFIYIALGVGVFVSLCYLSAMSRRVVILLSVVGSQIFFLNYIRLYLMSAAIEFKTLLIDLYNATFSSTIVTNIAIVYPLIFLWGMIGILTLLFYVFGSLGYLFKTWKSEEGELEGIKL